MSFLPGFGRRRNPRVVIVGGGYAGLAALITLRRKQPKASLVLIDPEAEHLKITHLHETLRRPLGEFLVPYRTLAQRFGFRHIRASAAVDEQNLSDWQRRKQLTVAGETLRFDYLVIATGAAPIKPGRPGAGYDLDSFRRSEGRMIVKDFLQQSKPPGRTVTVVGGGASGIQFLFELNELFKDWRDRHGLRLHLRLVHSKAQPLDRFPEGFGRYVAARMEEEQIEYVGGCHYLGREDDAIVLQDHEGGGIRTFTSHVNLLFLGRQPRPCLLTTNAFGQVKADGETLEHIFAAGDCAHLRGLGSNQQSAQVAVRKGKLIARNLLRHFGPIPLLEPYWYREPGYFVSLGEKDGVGCLGPSWNVVTGLPALAIKEAVEAQFDLLLRGIDTYLL
jgi:NADH dehydrogenase